MRKKLKVSENLIIRQYSITEISNIYGVGIKTIKKWLKPYAAILGKRVGRYYSISQVELIFNKLGIPYKIKI